MGASFIRGFSGNKLLVKSEEKVGVRLIIGVDLSTEFYIRRTFISFQSSYPIP